MAKQHNPLHAMQSGVHVAKHAGRLFSRPIRARLQKQGLRHRLHDAAILILLGILIGIGVWRVVAADPGRRVDLTAVVAPADIVSGGDSTLSISYKNTSRKTLNNVTLSLTYPPYFHLLDVEDETFEPQTNTLSLGTLAPGANGLVKIRGVMFGDVGGDQVFTSTLAYQWAENKEGAKEDDYRFSPSRSALNITTTLPDQLVSGQRIEGTIELTNTGLVTFPEASIHAEFPDNFRLRETSLTQREDTTWIVPEIEPTESLLITYAGTLDLETGQEARFFFEPSFVFGDERFVQETLTETVATVPAPVTASLETPEFLSAGKATEVTVRWSDQSDLAIENPILTIEGATNTPEITLDTPVIAGERTFSVIPRTSGGTNRTATLKPVITFTTPGSSDRISVVGDRVERRVTTSIGLNGFARYFTSAGDQLGRGPLPPRAGESTIYWTFLNLSNTFNTLDNVTVTAQLPANVSWVDKQSVTTGSYVSYNSANRTIAWSMDSLDATVTSGRVAAASFALSITPSASQIGTTPALLSNVRVTGVDRFTGQRVSATLGTITNVTPEDNGRVR